MGADHQCNQCDRRRDGSKERHRVRRSEGRDGGADQSSGHLLVAYALDLVGRRSEQQLEVKRKSRLHSEVNSGESANIDVIPQVGD